MVLINFAKKLVTCKIVYYGPGLSGKTTNLEVIYDKIPDNRKGQLTSIKTQGVGGDAGDRTLFFDYLPLELGKVAGMTTRFQMFTVPGQVYYNSTRKLVLQNVDGIVFVADSSRAKLAENHESFKNLLDNLREYNLSIRKVPLVMQWNKRDLPDAMEIAALEEELNIYNFPSVEAVATTGKGVFPTLKQVASMVLDNLNSQQIAQRARPERSSPRGPHSPPVQEQAQEDVAPIKVDRRQDAAGRRLEDRVTAVSLGAPDPPPAPPAEVEAEAEAEADAQPTLQMERPGRAASRPRGPRSPEPKSPPLVPEPHFPLPAQRDPAVPAPEARASQTAAAAPTRETAAALPKGDASDWDIDTQLSAKPGRKGVGGDVVIPGLGDSAFELELDPVRPPDDEPTKVGLRRPAPAPKPQPQPEPEEYEIAVDAPTELSPEEAAAMLAAELGEAPTDANEQEGPQPDEPDEPETAEPETEEPVDDDDDDQAPAAETDGAPDEDTITVDMDDLEPQAEPEATEEIEEADLEAQPQEGNEQAEAEAVDETPAGDEGEELEPAETAKAQDEDLEIEDLDLDVEPPVTPARVGPKAPPKKRKLGVGKKAKAARADEEAETDEIDTFEDSEDVAARPLKKSRLGLVIILLLLLSVAALFALDYTRVLDLGISEMLGLG